jgi:hypothetical protein
VRQLTVDAVVDTGSGPLVITEAMRQQLGLAIESKTTVFLAGKVPHECLVAELVKIIWQDRFSHSNPVVLEDGDTIILWSLRKAQTPKHSGVAGMQSSPWKTWTCW